MDSNMLAVELSNVNKTFTLTDKPINSLMERFFTGLSKARTRKLSVLKNVHIKIAKGERVGIVGRNGCGKSTLLKIILGAIPPDSGSKVETTGRILRLSLGIGFDLNLTARENILVNGTILGIALDELRTRAQEIVDYADLTDFIDTQVKFFSSGMVARLAFAVAVESKADIFLLDEFLGGVGDIGFREKSDLAFKTFLIDKTTVIVSHEMQHIRDYCDRVIVMDNGEVIFDGNVSSGIELYESLFIEQ